MGTPSQKVGATRHDRPSRWPLLTDVPATVGGWARTGLVFTVGATSLLVRGATRQLTPARQYATQRLIALTDALGRVVGISAGPR